jgi:hypothetical protein
MTIAELTLAAVTALAPPTDVADAARLKEAARAIAAAAEATPLWPSDAGRAATASLLVAIAFHESGLREDVQRCRVRGDRGRSLGMFQLMRDASWSDVAPQTICDSDALQARLAAGALSRFRRVCEACFPQRWINGYASGDVRKPTRAASEIALLWIDISARHRLVVRPNQTDPPTWAPPG